MDERTAGEAGEGRAAGADGTLFAAILHPHRSLSRRGFLLVMGAAVAVSIGFGGYFALQGAWPVFGFYGLEILILYLCLRNNYRSALIYEKVRLTEEALTVEKGDRHGPTGTWSFQPYWLKVSIDDPVRHESQLTLSSHGRALVVGAFLTPEERVDFARALRDALAHLQRPVRFVDSPA